MADVYIVALSILGIWITGPGLMLGLIMLLPGRTEQAHTRLTRSPWISFLVGLVITFLVSVVAAVAANVGDGGISAVVVLIGLTFWAIGASGMTRIAADKIEQMTGSDNRMRSLLYGAVLLELAGFVPLIGWFLFTPLVGITQVGAGALGLFSRIHERQSAGVEQAPGETIVSEGIDPGVPAQSAGL